LGITANISGLTFGQYLSGSDGAIRKAGGTMQTVAYNEIEYSMNIPNDYRHWHEFAHTVDCLVWDEYGYCQESKYPFVATPPDWFTREAIEKAKAFALQLVSHDIRLIFEVSEDGKHGKWATVDDANKIIFFDCGVNCALSGGSPESYMRGRHATHSRLYGGIVEALIVYKKTGVACLPDWNTNQLDTYGYKNGNRNAIPRTREARNASTAQA